MTLPCGKNHSNLIEKQQDEKDIPFWACCLNPVVVVVVVGGWIAVGEMFSASKSEFYERQEPLLVCRAELKCVARGAR